MWPKYVSNKIRIWRENLLQNLLFKLNILWCHYWLWHWKSNIFHTLFGKYLDHMLVNLEQNRMIQNFELFGKNWLTIFEKLMTPFWKTFLWHKQLFDTKVQWWWQWWRKPATNCCRFRIWDPVKCSFEARRQFSFQPLGLRLFALRYCQKRRKTGVF